MALERIVGGGLKEHFSENPNDKGYVYESEHYDDAIMRQALKNLEERYKKEEYSLMGNNCQDFCELWKQEYDSIKQSSSSVADYISPANFNQGGK